MIKRVDGSEFQVAKRTIVATKLQEEDALIRVGMVTGESEYCTADKRWIFLKISDSR